MSHPSKTPAPATRKRRSTTKTTKTAKTTKAAAPKKAASKTATAPAPPLRTRVTVEERRRMIAEAAYYRAERRGFPGVGHERDWLEAEAEVDARLLGRLPSED